MDEVRDIPLSSEGQVRPVHRRVWHQPSSKRPAARRCGDDTERILDNRFHVVDEIRWKRESGPDRRHADLGSGRKHGTVRRGSHPPTGPEHQLRNADQQLHIRRGDLCHALCRRLWWVGMCPHRRVPQDVLLDGWQSRILGTPSIHGGFVDSDSDLPLDRRTDELPDGQVQAVDIRQPERSHVVDGPIRRGHRQGILVSGHLRFQDRMHGRGPVSSRLPGGHRRAVQSGNQQLGDEPPGDDIQDIRSQRVLLRAR